MVVHDLEKKLDQKVKPLLDKAMHEKLGITISEIESDISDKIKKSPLLDFTVNTKLKFKEAKKQFKKQYIARLLQLHFGNIAEVSRILGVDRRTIHRLVSEHQIDVTPYREVLLRGEYIKQTAVQEIIQTSFEQYKGALNPQKYEALYESAPQLSKDIVKELPTRPLSLKDAEREFEKRYLKKALREHGENITKTAKAIGLRFETLHRKLKELGISKE